MKFFKHFTDAHRGQSMTTLMEEMGHMGPCCYWILVEMCAEKLEKKTADVVTEDDCKFEFHYRIVRQNLKIGATNLQLFLNICSTIGLLSFKKVDNILQIEMPKLLECLDRDQKKARHLRAVSAPKIKNKDKDKEEDILGPSNFDFQIFYDRYKNRVNKAEGFRRLTDQIKSQQDYQDFEKAEVNYNRFLELPKNRDWLKPKQWDVFIGTKAGKRPWRDWIDPDPSVYQDSSVVVPFRIEDHVEIKNAK